MGTDTTHAEEYAETSANGAIMEGEDDFPGGNAATDFLNPNTLESDRVLAQETATGNDASYNEAEWALAFPDETALTGQDVLAAKNGNLAGRKRPLRGRERLPLPGQHPGLEQQSETSETSPPGREGQPPRPGGCLDRGSLGAVGRPKADRHERDASTEGMRAGGYYDAHSEYQRVVVEGGDETIQDAVAGLELADPGLTIADYGAGTGATSVHAMQTAIDAVRTRARDLPLLTVHNDVATNDFTQLFRNVTGDDGYLGTPGGPIYPAAAAGSFFTQVLPSATVDLGMCSNAAHWLREQPRVSTPDGMYFSQAGDARAELAAQAASDWVAFLEARTDELAPGGRLVVQGIGVSPDGEHVSADRLLRVMWQIASALAEDGLLDRKALDEYVFPVYCRSVAEMTAPLTGDGPLASRLEVVGAEEGDVANPYWAQFERDGDAPAYAKAYTEFVRAFAEPTMKAHLFEPAASGKDPDALSDEYFARLEASTAAEPEAGRYEAWIIRLVLGRTAGRLRLRAPTTGGNAMGFMDQFKDAMSAGTPSAADMEKMQQVTRLNEVGVEHPATIKSLSKTGRTDPEASSTRSPSMCSPRAATATPPPSPSSCTRDRWAAGRPREPRSRSASDPDNPNVMILWGGQIRAQPSATAASHSSLICGRGWGESSSTTPMWRPPDLARHHVAAPRGVGVARLEPRHPGRPVLDERVVVVEVEVPALDRERHARVTELAIARIRGLARSARASAARSTGHE